MPEASGERQLPVCPRRGSKTGQAQGGDGGVPRAVEVDVDVDVDGAGKEGGAQEGSGADAGRRRFGLVGFTGSEAAARLCARGGEPLQWDVLSGARRDLRQPSTPVRAVTAASGASLVAPGSKCEAARDGEAAGEGCLRGAAVRPRLVIAPEQTALRCHTAPVPASTRVGGSGDWTQTVGTPLCEVWSAKAEERCGRAASARPRAGVV